MCSTETRLCRNLVEEFFGTIVADVTYYMCQNGYQPLKIIASRTKLKLNQVRKALCVLLQHKMAKYQQFKQYVHYKADVENILNLIFYPRIIYVSKLLYGDAAELIIEEILHHGMLLMSSAIPQVVKRLQNFGKDGNLEEKVQTAFQNLVHTHFLIREAEVQVTEDSDEQVLVPNLHIDENNLYQISTSNVGTKRKLSFDDDDNQPQAKRSKTSINKSQNLPDDDGKYWSVNFGRFRQFFRDQAIVASVNKKHGSECSEVIRAMLRISEVTTPANATYTSAISAAEISRSLAAGFSLTPERIYQHLRLLSSSNEKIVELADDSGGGGSYVLNLKRAAYALAVSSIVTYVEERFGSKSCRIFRLLMLKKHLEQKQVEEFAMIPAKEAKEYLYCMLSENFLSLQEIPRTADHAPSRTFYLYAVDIIKISRMLLSKSCKGVANLITRQKHNDITHKRLLDKRRQIDAMKESIQGDDEEQLQDIEDMLSSSERGQLEKYEHCTNKLINGQLQISDTVFVLDSYLKTIFVPLSAS